MINLDQRRQRRSRPEALNAMLPYFTEHAGERQRALCRRAARAGGD